LKVEISLLPEEKEYLTPGPPHAHRALAPEGSGPGCTPVEPGEIRFAETASPNEIQHSWTARGSISRGKYFTGQAEQGRRKNLELICISPELGAMNNKLPAWS